jgi:Fe-S-cluster-containing hydrogenase component 2
VTCYQCNPAPCVDACTEEAIIRGKSDAWVIDRDKCIGCGLCVDACPYDVIVLDSENVAMKCDLCNGNPSCVEFCPTHAITFSK